MKKINRNEKKKDQSNEIFAAHVHKQIQIEKTEIDIHWTSVRYFRIGPMSLLSKKRPFIPGSIYPIDLFPLQVQWEMALLER